MINLFNIMNSIEGEEIALKKSGSILMAVSDAMQYVPNNSDCYAMAVYAALDIARNTEATLNVLKYGISDHLQAERIGNRLKEEKRSSVTEEKGGAR